MPYHPARLIRSFLDHADADDMQSLFILLCRQLPADISPQQKAVILVELREWLADASARDLVRNDYLNQLTDREVEVVLLLAAGIGSTEGAARLGIAPRTFRQHLENIKSKLGIKPRAGRKHVTGGEVIARIFGL